MLQSLSGFAGICIRLAPPTGRLAPVSSPRSAIKKFLDPTSALAMRKSKKSNRESNSETHFARRNVDTSSWERILRCGCTDIGAAKVPQYVGCAVQYDAARTLAPGYVCHHRRAGGRGMRPRPSAYGAPLHLHTSAPRLPTRRGQAFYSFPIYHLDIKVRFIAFVGPISRRRTATKLISSV